MAPAAVAARLVGADGAVPVGGGGVVVVPFSQFARAVISVDVIADE